MMIEMRQNSDRDKASRSVRTKVETEIRQNDGSKAEQ